MIGYFSSKVIVVTVSEVTFSNEASNIVNIVAHSIGYKARTKARFGNTVKIAGVAHKARSSGEVYVREYTSVTFNLRPADISVALSSFTFSPFGIPSIIAHSVAFKARSKAIAKTPIVVSSASVAHKARTRNELFIPPFEIVGRSTAPKARTSALVGIPYFLEGGGVAYKARSRASLVYNRMVRVRAVAHLGRSRVILANETPPIEVVASSIALKARTKVLIEQRGSPPRKRRVVIWL